MIGGIANLLAGTSYPVIIVVSSVPNSLRCLTVAIVSCVSYVLAIRTVAIVSERSKARLRSNQSKEKSSHLNVFHQKTFHFGINLTSNIPQYDILKT